MQYCNTCGGPFQGRGRHCSSHDQTRRYPYNLHERFNYNTDSTDPEGNHTRRHTLRNRPRVTRFADDDVNNYYNNRGDQEDYHIHEDHDRQRNLVRYRRGNSNNNNVNTSLTQPLVQTFRTLSRGHEIRSMTYTQFPHGVSSVQADANTEREQCDICSSWFPDHRKLMYHQQEYSAGCEEHGICIRPEDAIYHATREKHNRCFLRGCSYVYRREGDWKPGFVREHVKSAHYC